MAKRELYLCKVLGKPAKLTLQEIKDWEKLGFVVENFGLVKMRQL